MYSVMHGVRSHMYFLSMHSFRDLPRVVLLVGLFVVEPL